MSDSSNNALVQHDGSALDAVIDADLASTDQDSTFVTPTADSAVSGADSGESDVDTSLIHKVFGTPAEVEDDDETLLNDADDTEEDAEEAPKKKLSRRERRVVNLKKRLDKAEAERDASTNEVRKLQENYAGLYRNAQNVHTQFQANQTALTALQAEVRTLKEVGVGRGEVDEGQAALDKFQRDTVTKAESVVSPRVMALEKNIAALNTRLADQQKANDAAVKERRLAIEADRIVDEVLLGPNFPKHIRDMSVNEYGTTLRQRMRFLLLQEAYMRDVGLDEAVSGIIPFLKTWALGYFESQTSGRGDKIAQGQKTVSSGPGGRGPSTKQTKRTPTAEEAEEAGYENPFDMVIAQDLAS